MAHEHGEAFPREETSELVGEALRTELRRAWIQDALIALGLALFALGMPLARLLGRPVSSNERLHFLASAVCFALGWLVLARTARRNAWDSGAALRASLVAACAPVVLFAATTPGPAAAGWLGACLVLATLVREDAPPFVRVLAWIAASVLHPWNVWLWPAWFVRERRRAWCIGTGLLAAFALFERFPHRRHEILAGLDGGPGPFVAWWTLWIAGLGAASIGLVALRRSPPLWLVAFALVPLVPLSLGGTIGYDLPWIWLAPLGWLGMLELEKRGKRTGRLLAWALAFAGAGLVWARTTDPERYWRPLAEELLQPSDLVLTCSVDHRYLLTTRYGLEVRMLPAAWTAGSPGARELQEAVDRAKREGRRVVLDVYSLERGLDFLVDRETGEWAYQASTLQLLDPDGARR